MGTLGEGGVLAGDSWEGGYNEYFGQKLCVDAPVFSQIGILCLLDTWTTQHY